MSRATVNRICETFPGAEVSDPWGGGHDAWKVGGKMFACIGAVNEAVAVKCGSVEEAEHLNDLFGWPKAKYFHRSWVEIALDGGADEALLRHRLLVSYRTVRAGLPKKTQAALQPVPEA
ncbi:MmcQ/YjbR family DNA-binding protein [Wenxinia marina]|uniref:MmcQ/YjbR family DNA-binding protein n=1 Tax=Wenxinia marina DSM 24838 TaxID=1123501 RepID=A0A0D0PZL6_9RHOB|nr:MmcQ/YjbR family DNA-binding protein [Wenxinia marina]KIQ67799.1 hypothetical protein Wenmar_03528 [Wenxinia marina DSM 24838]GGL74957.1 hypothetical protein GCM10011392_31990 [Wenxinia marina]